MNADVDNALRSRPVPPDEVRDPEAAPVLFVPAPEMLAWVHANIIGDGPLYNEDHNHLLDAQLGFLWTNVPNRRHGRDIVGTCEIPNVQGGRWLKSRMEQQLCEWFDCVPDFLITFYAPWMYEQDDATFAASTEHEIYHAGQLLDEFGMPVFTMEGRPRFGIKGHDAEEHIGVVRRYGVGAAAGGVAALVEAAQHAPTVARASIASACGVCLR